MKKLVILVLLAALVVPFVLSGCSSQSPATSNPMMTRMPVYNDSGVINIGVNGEFIIQLETNPSTGYDWQKNFDSSYLTLVESDFEQTPGSEGRLGAGGTQYFRFKALKAGETKIGLAYARSWENRVPADTKEFTIKIK